MSYRLPDHKAGARLDYSIDLSLWQDYGEPVIAVTVLSVSPATLTLSDELLNGAIWRFIAEGGVAGQLYTYTLQFSLGGAISGRYETVELKQHALSPSAFGGA